MLLLLPQGLQRLQAALIGVPLVVVYKVFPLTYWLGRMIVKVKYVSLVNILSGREVVKELLQSEATTRNIVHELEKILSSESHKKNMMDAYARIRDIYSAKNASERVADMVWEMAGWKKEIMTHNPWQNRGQIYFTTESTEAFASNSRTRRTMAVPARELTLPYY